MIVARFRTLSGLSVSMSNAHDVFVYILDQRSWRGQTLEHAHGQVPRWSESVVANAPCPAFRRSSVKSSNAFVIDPANAGRIRVVARDRKLCTHFGWLDKTQVIDQTSEFGIGQIESRLVFFDLAQLNAE